MNRSAWNNRPRSLTVTALLSVLVLLTAMAQPALAAIGPLGSEFRVNTYTTGDQRTSSAAMDSSGNFVVAWASLSQDGSGFGIFAQRYNSAGVAQGSEFRVNTYTTNDQRYPSVAMDPSGNFVVAWESISQDGSAGGVYAQRYNSAGVAQGSEFQVNTYTANYQFMPSVAMDPSGNFVIAWASLGQDGADFGVYAQRYNSAGAAQGSEFQVNTYTLNAQGAPSVAMDTSGNFVVAWDSNGQDGSVGGIFAQRYDSAGVAQGSEFRANTYTLNSQVNPSVAMDPSGNFVIAWESNGQDGSGYGVYGQRYNSAGVAQGSEFQVNTYTTLNQEYPAVAMDSSGNFVIAWSSYGQDGSLYGVYAQRYNNAGVAQGSEFQVNTYTTGDQMSPAVAMDSSGDFVVSWMSSQDGSGYGIYAQRYGDPTPPPVPVPDASEWAMIVLALFGSAGLVWSGMRRRRLTVGH